MKKICMIMIFLSTCLFFSCSMKSEESNKKGKFIQFPEKLFGINFCNLQIVSIIKELNVKKIQFKCYNENKEIECSKNNINLINGIDAHNFTGFGLDQSKIINVEYIYIPHLDKFILNIKMKEEYFFILYEILKKQFGYDNMYINRSDYGEISWNSDSWNPKPTCIEDIVLTKRLKFDPPEGKEKGICYLIINTRSMKPHVH